MKKFKRDGKINFVDENNVFVGYDTSQCCCERADWFISEKEERQLYNEKYQEYVFKDYPADELDKYIFDINYYIIDSRLEWLDEGSLVRFKLVANPNHPESAGCPELYLHLYNCHNGYYGHGFTMTINDEIKHEGVL